MQVIAWVNRTEKSKYRFVQICAALTNSPTEPDMAAQPVFLVELRHELH